MGCGCHKGPKLPVAVPAAFTAPLGPYENVSDRLISSRSPRVVLRPGETIDLNKELLGSFQIRNAIRRRALVLQA